MVGSVLGQILSVGHPGLAVHRSRSLFKPTRGRGYYLSRGYAPRRGRRAGDSFRHGVSSGGMVPGHYT